MKNINWNEIEDAGRRYPDKPMAGGYVIQITDVEDHSDKEYLRVSFDIAEGPSAGYMRDCESSFGYWPAMGVTVRSYGQKAQPWFKAFITALEESNPGFHWDSAVNREPGRAKGLCLGAVLANEEYRDRDGNVRENLRVRTFCSADRIRSGNYTVPGCKRLPGGQGSGAAAGSDAGTLGFSLLGDDDDELPF